ncbi:MAG: hypothetical protein ACO1SV_02160 [Fimbriimonas sp.]
MNERNARKPEPWCRSALEQSELISEHLRGENPDPDFVTRHAIFLLHVAGDEHALRIQADLPKAA